MQRLQTLGGCLVTRDGARVEALAGQRKALALLALLAAARERGVPRDTLLAQLWPESDEERGRTSLKQLVHSLRTRLGSPEAIGGSLDLRLDASAIAVDLWEFRDAIARGDHESAVALYGGPFLDGFFLRGADEFERWVAAERGALAAELIRSVEAVADRAGARAIMPRQSPPGVGSS